MLAFNEAAAARIQKTFERAIALTFGTKIERAGEFIEELSRDGQRREGSSTFSLTTLGLDFLAAEVSGNNSPRLREWSTRLQIPYVDEEGISIIVALDRYVSAMSRESPLDANLDLCIAAEILFLRFGEKRVKNDEIAGGTEGNAAAFLGDGEYPFGWRAIADVVDKSYKERSRTVHGREGFSADRARELSDLNSQLREIIKAALRVFVEARPTRKAVRHVLTRRTAMAASGSALPPISAALKEEPSDGCCSDCEDEPTSVESAGLAAIKVKINRLARDDRTGLRLWV